MSTGSPDEPHFLWQRVTLLPDEVEEAAESLSERVREAEPGVVHVLWYEPEDVYTARDLLITLGSEPAWKGGVSFAEPSDPASLIQRPSEETAPALRLIHQAPRLPNIDAQLDVGSTTTQSSRLLCSGARREWEQILPEIPREVELHSLGESGARRARAEAEKDASRAVGLGPPSRALVTWLSLLHSAGVRTPLAVLVRLMVVGGEENNSIDSESVRSAIAASSGFLRLRSVDGEDGVEAVATTNSEVVARMVATRLFDRESAAEHGGILARQLDPASSTERRLLLSFFGGLLRTGRASWVRSALDRARDQLAVLWPQTELSEALQWADIAVQLTLPDLGMHALDPHLSAAARENRPVRLNLARARLLHAAARARQTDEHVQEARGAFRELLASENDNPYVLHAYAQFESDVGEPQAAIRLYRHAVDAHPDNPFLRTSGAAHFLKAGEIELAEEIIAEARATVSTESATRLYLLHVTGEIARHRLEYAAAERAYFRVLELDEENLAALTSLGSMAADRGHAATAEYWLERALAVHRESAPALLRHAQNVLKPAGRTPTVEEFEAVIRRLERLTSFDPVNLRALTALTSAYRRADRLPRAADTLERVREIAPRSPYLYVEEAQLLWSEDGATQEVEELLLLARDLGGIVVAQTLLGRWAIERNEMARGRDHYQAALAKARGLERIKVLNQWAGTIEGRHSTGENDQGGDDEKAVELLERSRRLDPFNAFTIAAIRDLGFSEDLRDLESLLNRLRERRVSSTDDRPNEFENVQDL